MLLLVSVGATQVTDGPAVPDLSEQQQAHIPSPQWHPLHLHSCTLYPETKGVYSSGTTTTSTSTSTGDIRIDSVRVHGDAFELNPSILLPMEAEDNRGQDPAIPALYTTAPTLQEYRGTLWFVQLAYGSVQEEGGHDYPLTMHGVWRQLESLGGGAEVVHFIAPRTFLLSVPHSHTDAYIAQVRTILGKGTEHHVWVHPVHASYKVVPELAEDIATLLLRREMERDRRLHLRLQGETEASEGQDPNARSKQQSQQTPWHPSIDLSSYYTTSSKNTRSVSGEAIPRCIEILAHLVPTPMSSDSEGQGKDNEVVSTIVQQWKQALYRVPHVHSVKSHSPTIIGVTVVSDTSCVREVVTFLAHDLRVLLVEPRMQFSILNYEVTSLTLDGRPRDTSNADQLSLHARGIHGAGEVISVIDTGIDYSSCFFVDPMYTGPALHNNIGLIQGHRKLHSLFRAADADVVKGDVRDGHGSHVCGTAAGKVIHDNEEERSYNSRFNGVAPEAKLSVTSVSKGDDVVIDPDLRRNVFPQGYGMGVRIFSNSWGCLEGSLNACNRYGETSAQIDLFMWENRDAVFIFATGNSGTAQRTVLSPSIAKNVIAVGASVTSTAGLVVSSKYENQPELRVQYSEALCSQRPVRECCPNCFQSEEECCAFPDTLRCCPQRQSQVYLDAPDKFGHTNLAFFSSVGPTADGRTKPDLIAPGLYVTSARADGDDQTVQCSLSRPEHGNQGALIMKAGTSMSAPAVAGAAALVRQYFRQGFYPQGYPLPEQEMVPTGALVKAMLIHSGQPLEGGVVTSSATYHDIPKETPSIFFGFGRLSLDKVLSNDSRLYIKDSLGIVKQGEVETVCFTPLRNADGVEEVKITLTYTDYPGSTLANRDSVLVNDLDLSIRHIKSDVVSYGNGAPDALNNVEQITLSQPHWDQVYSLQIAARRLVHGPQPYALVITGARISTDTSQCQREKKTAPWIAPVVLGVAAGVLLTLAVGSFVMYHRRATSKANILAQRELKRTIRRDALARAARRTHPSRHQRSSTGGLGGGGRGGSAIGDDVDSTSDYSDGTPRRGRPGQTMRPPIDEKRAPVYGPTELPPLALRAELYDDGDHDIHDDGDDDDDDDDDGRTWHTPRSLGTGRSSIGTPSPLARASLPGIQRAGSAALASPSLQHTSLSTLPDIDSPSPRATGATGMGTSSPLAPLAPLASLHGVHHVKSTSEPLPQFRPHHGSRSQHHHRGPTQAQASAPSDPTQEPHYTSDQSDSSFESDFGQDEVTSRPRPQSSNAPASSLVSNAGSSVRRPRKRDPSQVVTPSSLR